MIFYQGGVESKEAPCQVGLPLGEDWLVLDRVIDAPV